MELSPTALEVARANGSRLGLDVQWHAGSWWQPLHGQRFDLVLSNPPYIAGEDPHLAALTHEPMLALTPGGDGLDAIRAIVAETGMQYNRLERGIAHYYTDQKSFDGAAGAAAAAAPSAR